MGKDLGDIALNLLTDLLGAEVIATGPPRGPLPVTGHCSRCGPPTIVYGRPEARCATGAELAGHRVPQDRQRRRADRDAGGARSHAGQICAYLFHDQFTAEQAR